MKPIQLDLPYLYQSIFKRTPSSEAIVTWREDPNAFSRDLLKTLFQEIPNLENFKTVCVLGNITILVNNIKVPSGSNFKTEEAKSWIVEVNLKEKELDLILKCIPFTGDTTTACRTKVLGVNNENP